MWDSSSTHGKSSAALVKPMTFAKRSRVSIENAIATTIAMLGAINTGPNSHVAATTRIRLVARTTYMSSALVRVRLWITHTHEAMLIVVDPTKPTTPSHV